MYILLDAGTCRSSYAQSRDDVTSGPACVVTWSAARSPACRWLGTAAKFIMPGCASGMKAKGLVAAAAAAAAARWGGYGNAGGPMTDL